MPAGSHTRTHKHYTKKHKFLGCHQSPYALAMTKISFAFLLVLFLYLSLYIRLCFGCFSFALFFLLILFSSVRVLFTTIIHFDRAHTQSLAHMNISHSIEFHCFGDLISEFHFSSSSSFASASAFFCCCAFLLCFRFTSFSISIRHTHSDRHYIQIKIYTFSGLYQ